MTMLESDPVRPGIRPGLRTRRLPDLAPPYLLLGEFYIAATLALTFDLVRAPSIAWLALAALGVGVALIAPRGAVSEVFVSLPITLLVTWMTFSFVWVADPRQWRTDVVHLVPAVFATMLVVGVLPVDRTVRAIKAIFLVGVGVTYAMLLLSPSTATTHPAVGDTPELPGWHGTFGHKTGMMVFLAVGLITFMCFETNRRLRYGVYVATFVLAAGSQSATGLSAMFAMLVAAWWLGVYQRQERRFSAAYVAVSIAGAVALLLIMVVGLPLFVNAYGKDMTFTGRTQIWSASLDAIGKRPLVGYGLGGVWFNEGLEPTRSIIRDTGFRAWHAHNAVIEMLLEGGIIGLVLWVTAVGSLVVAAWRTMSTNFALARWVLLFCVVQLVIGISEVTLFANYIMMMVIMRGALARDANHHDAPTRRIIRPR